MDAQFLFLQSRLFPLSSYFSSLISQNNPVEPWSHSWDLGAPTFLLKSPNVLWVGVNIGVGPKDRGCYHSLPKAVICHHQKQRVQRDLGLICLYNFPYQLLIWDSYWKAGGDMNESFHDKHEKVESVCMQKWFGSYFISQVLACCGL